MRWFLLAMINWCGYEKNAKEEEKYRKTSIFLYKRVYIKQYDGNILFYGYEGMSSLIVIIWLYCGTNSMNNEY